MSEELTKSIARLQAWIKAYGNEKSPVFIRDLETVITAAQGHTGAMEKVT